MKLLTEAPVRISLFGSGTDVGEYASKYGGVCINLAVNVRQHFEFTNEDQVIKYPKGANENFYWTILNQFGIGKSSIWGFKATFDGDIESGLGSSAAAAVCLTAGLSKLNGEILTRCEIAQKAWDIEVNRCGLFGGKQDQYASALGGFNLMKFGDKVEVQSFHRGVAEKVVEHILLFDTRIRRTEPKLQEGLKTIDEKQKQALDIIKNLTNDAYHRIYKGDIGGIGKLLHDTWEYKKKSNKVSTPEIDAIYERARKLGALGGKLCGSGGGGYMVFIAEKEKHPKLREELGIKWVDFGGIDWTGVFSRYI